MKRHNAFLGAPFRSPFLGTFASVPLTGGSPTGWIAVPYATMKFNLYNRYLPQYWPPYIPVEAAPGQPVVLRREGS